MSQYPSLNSHENGKIGAPLIEDFLGWLRKNSPLQVEAK